MTAAAGRRRRIDHVLVATDFSAHAAQAVARAGRLPLARGARISLAHVLPGDVLSRKALAATERAAGQQLEQAAASLAATLALGGRSDVLVGSALYRGQPYVELIRHARAGGAELIVLGRRGRQPLGRRFIGTTADRVIRVGGTATLVVCRRATHAYRRPMIAVDLGDTARSVVQFAVRVAGPGAVAPSLVHAYHAPFEGFVTPGASQGELTEYRKEYRRLAVEGMARVRASIGAASDGWQASVLCGDPRSVILAEAARREADLIAVGTHGRRGLSHVLIGSVAEWVIRAASCDVLVARCTRVTFSLP
jgi:nucleotide-binding universal stress UspA family protein